MSACEECTFGMLHARASVAVCVVVTEPVLVRTLVAVMLEGSSVADVVTISRPLPGLGIALWDGPPTHTGSG